MALNLRNTNRTLMVITLCNMPCSGIAISDSIVI